MQLVVHAGLDHLRHLPAKTRGQRRHRAVGGDPDFECWIRRLHHIGHGNGDCRRQGARFVGRLGLFVGVLTRSPAQHLLRCFRRRHRPGAQAWFIVLILIWVVTSSALARRR